MAESGITEKDRKRAQALRENLKRRKEQAKARQQEPDGAKDNANESSDETATSN